MLISTTIWIISVSLYEAALMQNVFHLEVNLVVLLCSIFVLLLKEAQNAVCLSAVIYKGIFFFSISKDLLYQKSWISALVINIYAASLDVYGTYMLCRDWQNHFSFLKNDNNLVPLFWLSGIAYVSQISQIIRLFLQEKKNDTEKWNEYVSFIYTKHSSKFSPIPWQ